MSGGDKEQITFRQMCETIVRADFLTKKDGTKPTWREIWEYSPSGELYMVNIWYKRAKYLLGDPDKDDK